jgi:AcrR family transcriptional regulator
VLDAALAIVDTQGLDALTMRSLAAALGTGAASLYAYVDSKEQLIELLTERVLGEVEIEGEPDPERWKDQFKAIAFAIREMYTRHGDIARASFGRIPVGENGLVRSEAIAAILRAGGISDEVIGLGMDLFGLYIGASSYEDSLQTSAGVTLEEFHDYTRQLRAYIESLPADRFPNLISLAGAMTVFKDRFEWGLDVIIAGMVALSSYQ